MALLTDDQTTQWNDGSFTTAHQFLGAHTNKKGTTFRVWAPNAQEVHVVGDFNDWQQQQHPMKKISEVGKP